MYAAARHGAAGDCARSDDASDASNGKIADYDLQALLDSLSNDNDCAHLPTTGRDRSRSASEMEKLKDRSETRSDSHAREYNVRSDSAHSSPVRIKRTYNPSESNSSEEENTNSEESYGSRAIDTTAQGRSTLVQRDRDGSTEVLEQSRHRRGCR